VRQAKRIAAIVSGVVRTMQDIFLGRRRTSAHADELGDDFH
jgi:hypothetical protein